MKLINKKVSFIDADGKRAVIEAEITNRNGYFEFTASGTYLNSGGQCLDRIKPATDKQRELIDLWKKYHLKSVEKMNNFSEHLEGIISVIEHEEKERDEKQEEADKGKDADELLLSQMEEYGIDEDNLNACRAYLDVTGADDLSDFEEAYSGEYSSDEEFAKQQAEDTGSMENDLQWPYTCIDWEWAARDLMMDYNEQDGYYFRAL